MSGLRIPVATYRIQFSRDFRFTDARDLIPYLHELGITDLYSSPRFRPRRGSSHGYDVAVTDRVNPDLGTEDEFDDLCARLKAYGMGLVLDIVPNHMAASHENPWWMDVLEHGPSSIYAEYFDIDWHPKITKAVFLQDGKVLVPVLGEFYGEVLKSGRLSLSLEDSGFYLNYWERRFPIDTSTCAVVLEACAAQAEADGSAEAAATLREIGEATHFIPGREDLSPEQAAERVAAIRELEQKLFLLHRDDMRARQAIDRALGEFAAGPRRLHELLQLQAYRLAHWRIASEEINYRRFFDINDLVSLRVELPHVFEARHIAIKSLVEAGLVTGLRIDHIDGLLDPREYLDRLRTYLDGTGKNPAIYTVVEKILGKTEELPGDWAAAGTTGYDFLNAVNDLFIDAEGLEHIETAHRTLTRDRRQFAEQSFAANRLVMKQLFAGEVERLTGVLLRLASRHWIARDIPGSELREALVEITACLPVYRTYAGGEGLSKYERKLLEHTLEVARERMGESINVAAWRFLREVLLLEAPDYDPDLAEGYLSFLRQWQQFTGPVMAKGLEDTAFYRHTGYLARNEVGGDPLRETPPRSPEQVHEFLARRARMWPHSLNTTSTHDTKRSEDVRARLNVLSEMPDRWIESVERWRRQYRRLRRDSIPSPDEEAMIYQSLLGAWPFDPAQEEGFRERMGQFLRKALREAKLHSGWLAPNEDYENAVVHFAEAILPDFGKSFAKLWQTVAYHGAWNSLSQVVVKATAPGVPDFYQGQEMWTFHLVDPDNRVPVDYAPRRDALNAIRQTKTRSRRAMAMKLAREWRNGIVKMFVTDEALNLRREHATLFTEGEYVPLRAAGEHRDSVFAFARCVKDSWAIVIAPRLTTRISGVRGGLGAHAEWGDTRLTLPEGAPRQWANAFTSRSVNGDLDMAAALDGFPVAILTNDAPAVARTAAES